MHRLVNKLLGLVQVEIDAFHAFGEAIKRVDHDDVRRQLEGMREDHARHVAELSQIIDEHGGAAPRFSRDFRGFTIAAFTAVRGVSGTQAVLGALRMVELMTTGVHDEVLGVDLPGDVLRVVSAHRRDEQRHLQGIMASLEARPWEEGRPRRGLRTA